MTDSIQPSRSASNGAPAEAAPISERVLMHTEARVAVTNSPDKLVTLPHSDTAVPMGMHDELADFYGAAPGSFTPHASTLDYVVGALTACLAGTFKRALGARGVAISPEALEVRGTGEIMKDGDVPVIRRVSVEYTLSGTSPEQRECDRARSRVPPPRLRRITHPRSGNRNQHQPGTRDSPGGRLVCRRRLRIRISLAQRPPAK